MGSDGKLAAILIHFLVNVRGYRTKDVFKKKQRERKKKRRQAQLQKNIQKRDGFEICGGWEGK